MVPVYISLSQKGKLRRRFPENEQGDERRGLRKNPDDIGPRSFCKSRLCGDRGERGGKGESARAPKSRWFVKKLSVKEMRAASYNQGSDSVR